MNIFEQAKSFPFSAFRFPFFLIFASGLVEAHKPNKLLTLHI